VQLRSESLKEVEMDAKISFIAPVATVKNNIKGFEVRALIDKPNPRLRPGMSVNMSIPIRPSERCVSVPISAVFKDEGDKRVVYVRNGGSTEKREVKIGVTNVDYAQIINGLNEGETIMLVEPGRGGESEGWSVWKEELLISDIGFRVSSIPTDGSDRIAQRHQTLPHRRAGKSWRLTTSI
jgi:multidrug efflux pump subunit AcrA (membrane-fusion protein)